MNDLYSFEQGDAVSLEIKMLPPGCDNTPNDPLHDDRLCIYRVGKGHARNPIFVRAFGAHSMVEAGTVILPADAMPPLASGVGDATYKIQYEHPNADPALFVDNVNNVNVTKEAKADLAELQGALSAAIAALTKAASNMAKAAIKSKIKKYHGLISGAEEAVAAAEKGLNQSKIPVIPVMGCRPDMSKILGYTFASVPPQRPEQPNATVR